MQLSSYRPIYSQLVDLLAMEILDQTIKVNSSLPPIDSFAIQINMNPNTVEKAYDQLLELGAVTKKGEQWIVANNAIEILQKYQQEKFLKEEFPALSHRLKILGINPQELNWQQPKEHNSD